jgi:hypothetical protein
VIHDNTKKRKKKNKSIRMVKSIKQNAEKYYKVFDQIRFNIFLERYFITYTATLENTIKSTSYHCVKTILIIQRQIRHSLIQRLPNAECLQQKRWIRSYSADLITLVFCWCNFMSDDHFWQLLSSIEWSLGEWWKISVSECFNKMEILNYKN